MKIFLDSSEFFFPDAVAKKLQYFIDNPSDLPKVTCFHGYPGIGKTSFAKAFASAFACETKYKPMNESKVDPALLNDSFSQSASLLPFLMPEEDTRPLARITILDEFHNLSPKQQDQFKVRFDNLGEDERVIICLNTEEDRGRYLKQKVTDAILSRLYDINFNLQRFEIRQFIDEIQQRYTYLKSSQIHAYLPDMRKIERENAIAKRLPL